jgi:hypothetical protein
MRICPSQDCWPAQISRVRESAYPILPKSRISVREAALTIAGSVLRFSAQATQQVGDLVAPRSSFLKRAVSSRLRNAERLEVLKLNCDIVIPHVAVAEYNLEHGDYWDRTNSESLIQLGS